MSDDLEKLADLSTRYGSMTLLEIASELASLRSRLASALEVVHEAMTLDGRTNSEHVIDAWRRKAAALLENKGVDRG